jgi:hypothetical protein
MTGSNVCASCGRPLRAGARFCTSCGAPVLAAAPIVIDPSPAVPASRSTLRGERSALAAAFDGARTAGTGARLVAYLVDLLVVGVVAGAVLLLTNRVALGALVGAELAVGLVVWEARTGRTFGNVLLGLRTSRLEAPYALGTGRAVGRALVLGAGHVVALGQWLVVGSAAFDRSGLRQGWHDKAGRAVVVDVRGPRSAVAAAYAAGPGAESRAAAAAAPTNAAAVRLAPAQPGRAAAATDGNGWTPPAPATPRAYLVTLDTGQAMTVSGPGLVGRAPQVTPGERCEHLIAIDDPERSLSRTHARFGVDARAGFWISDAGSGNGTIVTAPSGQTVVAPPDQRFTVQAVRA